MYQDFNNAQLQKEDEQVTLEMNTNDGWRWVEHRFKRTLEKQIEGKTDVGELSISNDCIN